MSTTIDLSTATEPPLEAEARAFEDAGPLVLYELGPEKGRDQACSSSSLRISLGTVSRR